MDENCLFMNIYVPGSDQKQIKLNVLKSVCLFVLPSYK